MTHTTESMANAEKIAAGLPVGKHPNKEHFPFALFSENTAQRNHGQSLRRLAERGGMSWCEAAALIERRPWFKMDQSVAEATVRAAYSEFLRREA